MEDCFLHDLLSQVTSGEPGMTKLIVVLTAMLAESVLSRSSFTKFVYP